MKPGQPIESPEAPFILPARYQVKWPKVLAAAVLGLLLLVVAWGVSSIVFFKLVGWLFPVASAGLPSPEASEPFLQTSNEKFIGLGMCLIVFVGIARMAFSTRRNDIAPKEVLPQEQHGVWRPAGRPYASDKFCDRTGPYYPPPDERRDRR